jgi:hypothetical protein
MRLDTLATLDAGSAPSKPIRVARTSLAASRWSDAYIRLRLAHVTKASRFQEVSAVSGA